MENSLAYRIYRRFPAGGFIRRLLQQLYFILLELWNIGLRLMPYCLQSLWLRLAGIQIGKKSAIHRGVRFLAFGNCTIGSGCIVNADCILDNRAGLCIGDNVSISNGCAIYSMGHDLDSPTFAMKGKTISIGDYACLFARALVMPGVVIGKGAVVCSGSVVVKSVEEFTVVGGNPAKFVKKRPLEHPSYRLNGRFYLST